MAHTNSGPLKSVRRLAGAANPFVRKPAFSDVERHLNNLSSAHAELTNQITKGMADVGQHLGALGGQAEETVKSLGNAHGRLDELAESLRKLWAHVRQHSRIEAVCQDGIPLFIYTDDLLYQFVPEECRGYQIKASDYPSENTQEYPVVDARGVYEQECQTGNLTTVLLSHYWSVGLDPAVVDIGASYGHETLYTARFIRNGGRKGIVYGFEPGIAGTLLEHNIVLNGLTAEVRIVRQALSDVHGPVLFFGEDGHSENNRLINRATEVESFSYIVPATTLDRYLEKNAPESDFIVKIDTQGAEPEVIRGMTRLLSRGVQTLICEFTPDILADRIDPVDFLFHLHEHGTVLLIGQSGLLAPLQTGGYATASDRAGFVEMIDYVRTLPYKWSDLLVVPYNLPERESLLKFLSARN